MSAALDYSAFFFAALTGYLVLYFATNGVSAFLYASWWGDWSESRTQPDRAPAAGQVWREIRLSALNLPIFATSATIAYGFYRQGWTQIYLDLVGTSWLYFAFTLLLLVAIHDAYFYWMHRLLHWKPLFRRVHRLHHLSLTPTSWAGYATHPVEGMLMSGDLMLFPLLFPVHPLAIVLFLVIQMSYSTFGHSGYDTFPRVFRRHRALSWHNTPSHHDDHHRYVHGNFSHFLNVWDWLMRTELPHGNLVREKKAGERGQDARGRKGSERLTLNS